MDPIEQALKALHSFKDWSNYLLVTTVAALGWTTKRDPYTFYMPWMKEAAVLLFAGSVVFAILTLAVIPHAAEDIQKKKNREVTSIYHVYWNGWFCRLTINPFMFASACLFLLGILFYAIGASFQPEKLRILFV